MPKLPPHLRAFDDAKAARTMVYDNTLSALERRFPVEDDDFRLELLKPRYVGDGDFDLEAQKKALISGRQLRRNIEGTWRLTDKKTNTVLDERKDTVLRVPYYTDRGTVIFNGNEYSVLNQSRLRPGAYTRIMRTGEVETQFNVKPGTGRGFRLHMDPDTGVFKTVVGQASIPTYPLLKTLGVDDGTLAQAWGADILAANRAKTDKRALRKYYDRFAGRNAVADASDDDMKQWLRENLAKTELDPETVERTLGLRGVTNLTPAAVVRATERMLAVNRGEEKPDDRDALMFSSIHGVEDLIPERIDRDAGRLAKNLLFRIKRDRNLSRLRAAALDPYIYDAKEGFLLGSRLAQPLEETSPISTLEQMQRITKLGVGGIGSSEAVTMDARMLNPSHAGFVDPVMGPESENLGIDSRIAYRTFKGNDSKIYAEFKNPATNRTGFYTPADTYDKVVAFPGEMGSDSDIVSALQRGEIVSVPKSEVDLEIPSLSHMFSSNNNLEIMPTAVQAERLFYGGKFWSQYLPQVEGEVPLVDTLMPDGKDTFSEHYGRAVGTMKSGVGGVVVKSDDSGVVVKDSDGKTHKYGLVKDLPFNRLTAVSYSPSVKVGDSVEVGDMIAHTNFTDAKTGAFNMGRNLKTVVAAFRGMGFEDGHIISETAAKKLATQRLEGFDRETRHGVEIGKNRFASLFPGTYVKDQLAKLDDNGVANIGAVLEKGDPIVLATGPKLLTAADAQLGKLHSVLRNAHTDKSVVWEHDYQGRVTDTHVGATGAKVNVASSPPVQIADKLSPRFGLKGVVAQILSDDKMPSDAATNEPYEIILNPAAIPSRVAPGQIVELALAKVAKATGKQVRIPAEAPKEGWQQWASNLLEEHGISESADAFDPETGKTIKGMGDGYVYVSAFHHLADKKLSARGDEGGYTSDMQPAKGGYTGGKRVSGMDVASLLGHGALEVLRDAVTVRGTKDDDFWRTLRAGRPLPEPKVPFVYDKFLNTLRAGGVNVTEKGDVVGIMPMTDTAISELAKSELDPENPGAMVDANFNPVPGGLFDPGKTGGPEGRKWSYIKLREPMPNPVMEEPIRRVLGLKVKQMRDILSGAEELGGLTGGAALKKALSEIDVDSEIKRQRDLVTKTRGANRDNAVKVIGYLEAAKKQKIRPGEWVLTRVPVLPPIFRPVSRLGDMALQADLNDLYKDVMVVNNNLRDQRQHFPDKDLGEDKLRLYDAVTAVMGLGESITPEGQARKIKGAIRQVIGTSPKTGAFQSKVLSKAVGAVGRGVITGDRNLDMDSIGIPEDAAWSLYKDFVIRDLVRAGYPLDRAMELTDNRDPKAKSMLEREMSRRPVIADRAPAPS